MKNVLWLLVMILISCSSIHLVDNWKNPNIIIFNANKVLLVGMTQNQKARIDFESKLKKEFDIRGVEAIRSIDVFDVIFTDSVKTEQELNKVEQQLLDKDFDAILFTKIVGSENKKMFRKTFSDFDRLSYGFKKDYLDHQEIYFDTGYYQNFTVYHAETALYCICVDKKRALIWRGSINITDPIDISKTVDHYVKLVILAMTEQDLIFRKEHLKDARQLE